MSRWDFYTTREIRPRGWLRRQLEIQADGLSGHLDEIWPDVRDSAWIGGDRDGWERLPYWLDGFIPLAYLLEDEAKIARAKGYMDTILSRQRADGWICPCADGEQSRYDVWAVLLITKVMVVYYECSADERVPAALHRVLKNLHTLMTEGVVRLTDWGHYRWFEGLIAIDFLQRRSAEPWLAELAALLKEQGADYAAFTHRWERPLNEWRYDTHIVNIVMMLKAEAECGRVLEEDYTDRAERFYELLHRYHGMPAGTFTGDECLSGRSPIQGTELCAVVEQMYSYERLYAFTGDSKWAERLERVAFNALPATISEDMWTHQYVQMSNQIACQRFPGKSVFRTNNSEAHLFGLEPNFGCCTANMHQGWPKLTLTAYLHKGEEIISALPIPSSLDEERLWVELETNYPFDHRLTYTLYAKADVTFSVRVPSFAEQVTVDGVPVEGTQVTVALAKGERRRMQVDFSVTPRLVESGNGLWTAQWGSLVFALPVGYEAVPYEYQRDGVERKYPYCDYEYVPLTPWNYGYAEASLTVEKRTMGQTPFAGVQPPVVMRATLRPIDWGWEDGYDTVCAKTPRSVAPIGAAQETELIPYGCARLRMTEMPIVT